jgi:dUTP pyrophosphatase
MEEVKLYVEKVFPNATLPKRANPTDSGLDVTFNNIKRIYRHIGGNNEYLIESDEKLGEVIKQGYLELQYLERALIGTGIKATVGPGYEIQVRPRSGLALKQGLGVCNAPGTIDCNYRDEIGVIVINYSRKVQKIALGDRIAQLVVAPVILCDVIETKLDSVDRGGGFGSSGTK